MVRDSGVDSVVDSMQEEKAYNEFAAALGMPESTCSNPDAFTVPGGIERTPVGPPGLLR